jgi:hypothetical protein
MRTKRRRKECRGLCVEVDEERRSVAAQKIIIGLLETKKLSDGRRLAALSLITWKKCTSIPTGSLATNWGGLGPRDPSNTACER